MAAQPDPRAGLARRLFERTGDRQAVIDGMTSRGYSDAEASAAADEVAPAGQPDSTPGAAGGNRGARAGTPAKGSPRAKSQTPPRGGSAKAGRGLFSGRGRSSAGGVSPSLSLPRRPDAGDVAGFGFGLVLYMLALQYLEHGPDGVKGWLGAKFLNRPYVPADTGTGATNTAGDVDTGLTSLRPSAPTNV